MSSSIIKVKSSLLFLTQKLSDLKKNVVPLLEESIKYTNNNLYIYINPAPLKNSKEPHHSTMTLPLEEDRFQLKLLLAKLYQNSFKINPNVNVTCLLHNYHNSFKIVSPSAYSVLHEYDLILTDSISDDHVLIESHLQLNLPNFKRSFEKIPLYTIKYGQTTGSSTDTTESNHLHDQILNKKSYKNSVMGGTFDRLHIGHKIMLSESVLLTENRLLIGMACENLLVNKKLLELLQDIDTRCRNVKSFLHTIAPNLEVLTVPITDPFGPSITEKDYQVILGKNILSCPDFLILFRKIIN